MDRTMLTYRGDGAWGTGKGAELTAPEFDGNTFDLDQRIVALETTPPQANGIADISGNGSIVTVTMDDATLYMFDIPVWEIGWKGEFAGGQTYQSGSEFRVTGSGIYRTLIGHTTVAPFDPARLIGGAPVYVQVLGDFGTPYDLPFNLNENPAAGDVLARVRVPRALSIDADFAGAQAGKSDYGGVDPVGVYVISIRDDTVEIGTVTLTPTTAGASAAWATAGGTSKTIAAGSEITFHAPDDGTAQDLSVAFWTFAIKAQVVG